MRCLVEVGNTNIVFGIALKGSITHKWRMATNSFYTEDEFFAFLKPLLEANSLNFSQFEGVAISSVVPRMNLALQKFAKKYFSGKSVFVGSPEFQHDLQIQIDNPNELGADLLCNALGALKLYNEDFLIVDFGTASTFTIVSRDRIFHGGAIAPGLRLTAEALSKGAAQLPDFAIAKPKKVCGTETVESMRSGIYYGYLSLVEGMIQKMKKEYAKPIRVLATGGLGATFSQETGAIDVCESDLTLIGLDYAFEYNTREL